MLSRLGSHLYKQFELARLAKSRTMAWYCSGSTNNELIENLFKVGLIKNQRVKEAMLGVKSTLPRSTPVLIESCLHSPDV